MERLCLMEKKKKRKEKQARRKRTSGCSALSISHWNLLTLFCTRRPLHVNTLIGTRRKSGGKRRLLATISCHAAFQEMVNMWDHYASSSWMCFRHTPEDNPASLPLRDVASDIYVSVSQRRLLTGVTRSVAIG